MTIRMGWPVVATLRLCSTAWRKSRGVGGQLRSHAGVGLGAPAFVQLQRHGKIAAIGARANLRTLA
jgi:hypothetical protein